jgi:hypothetical protein
MLVADFVAVLMQTRDSSWVIKGNTGEYPILGTRFMQLIDYLFCE